MIINLSPYEKNRIIPNSFGLTEMGRDLLAEDYILKQITASLIYPENKIGKEFWNKVYAEAQQRFGTTNIPVNTFNKVWIVPAKAVIYENTKVGTAYVVESKLKIMLEEDYLSLQKHNVETPLMVSHYKDATNHISTTKDINALGSQVIRQIIIPALTKEVNEGQNFAQLRQVYNSLILATWYKKKIKDSILSKVYEDRNKINGLSFPKSTIGNPENIYQQYLQAFKKGVYNYIKEDINPQTHEVLPRKYFSGGMSLKVAPSLSYAMNVPVDRATTVEPLDAEVDITPQVPQEGHPTIDDFRRFRNKRFIILDDDKNILGMYKRLLADYIPQENIFMGTSPQEGMAQIEQWKTRDGINTRDIVVLTDFQFEGKATAIDLIGPLRKKTNGKPYFEGSILIASGSMNSKSIGILKDGKLAPEVERAYGILYQEKNGQLDFREQLLRKLWNIVEHPFDPHGFTDEPVLANLEAKAKISEEINSKLSGINELETQLGERLSNLKAVIEKRMEREDPKVTSLIKEIQSYSTFGNVHAPNMEVRTHNYQNRLHTAISESLSDLKTYLSSRGLDDDPEILNQYNQVLAFLDNTRAYARFLNQMFFHMRGMDKLNALKPLLESAIGQYYFDDGEQSTKSFNPNLGIGIALNQLDQANNQMQQGIMLEAMLQWGKLYNQYKAIHEQFDRILGQKADKKTLAFMNRFSGQLNNFFGQYLQRFGHNDLKVLEAGSAEGRLVVLDEKATEEEIRQQLENMGENDIVVMDQNYSNLSNVSERKGSREAKGFIFGKEGASHLSTRARTLGVPLLILPNAVEYLRQFNGKDQWVQMESRDGRGLLRFMSKEERQTIPALKRQPIVARPVERDLEGDLMMSIDDQPELSLQEMARKMGYKAANLYLNAREDKIKTPRTETLLNQFIENLLDDNPQIRQELHVEFSQIDRNNEQSIRTHLQAMQKLIMNITVPQGQKEMIWESLQNWHLPYLILRLTTGAEDLEDFPGVGAGVYGTLERIAWKVKKESARSPNGYDWETPPENKENLIQKILEAYASFWSFDAYQDREIYGMGNKHWEIGNALMIQEYETEAKYSVLVHTADSMKEEPDTNIMKIEIVPGAGRSLSAPEAHFQGNPLTLFYDKEKKEFIGLDDPRKQYRPIPLDKSSMLSLESGEIKPIDYSIPELKTMEDQIALGIKLGKAIIPAALEIEDLHGRAQDIEGVINVNQMGQYVFVNVQSRAQAKAKPYPGGRKETREYPQWAKDLNAWLDQYGRESFQNLDFYKGRDFESPSLRKFIPERYERSSDLISELFKRLNMKSGSFEGITKLYHLLMSSNDFADIREGLLRRIFFYAVGMHNSFDRYFNVLQRYQPDLFLKIIPYAIIPMSQGSEFDGAWFLEVNAAALIRAVDFDNLPMMERLISTLSLEDMISLVKQIFWFDSEITAKPKYFIIQNIASFLLNRPDSQEILQSLDPSIAEALINSARDSEKLKSVALPVQDAISRGDQNLDLTDPVEKVKDNLRKKPLVLIADEDAVKAERLEAMIKAINSDISICYCDNIHSAAQEIYYSWNKIGLIISGKTPNLNGVIIRSELSSNVKYKQIPFIVNSTDSPQSLEGGDNAFWIHEASEIKKFIPTSSVSPAMAGVSATGGIDLRALKNDLATKTNSKVRGSESEGIQFSLDPAMLARLQNTSGFTPTITHIQPIPNLRKFLGLNS